MYTSPRRKGSPSESRSSLRADHPRLNPTPLAINPAMPDGLANASRPHSKLRTRSPLCGKFSAGNPPLVPASARNCPPFIRVHSHADAQKSSGAFFRVSDGERCRKRPARVRSVLRASQGVRARDVMVNEALFIEIVYLLCWELSYLGTQLNW